MHRSRPPTSITSANYRGAQCRLPRLWPRERPPDHHLVLGEVDQDRDILDVVRNDDGDRSYATSYVVNTADTWEHKEVTIPGDTSGTWLYDNRAACRDLAAHVGSNFISTPTPGLRATLWPGAPRPTRWTRSATVSSWRSCRSRRASAHPRSRRCRRTCCSIAAAAISKSFALATAPAQNVGSMLGAALRVPCRLGRVRQPRRIR